MKFYSNTGIFRCLPIVIEQTIIAWLVTLIVYHTLARSGAFFLYVHKILAHVGQFCLTTIAWVHYLIQKIFLSSSGDKRSLDVIYNHFSGVMTLVNCELGEHSCFGFVMTPVHKPFDVTQRLLSRVNFEKRAVGPGIADNMYQSNSFEII